MLFLKIYIGFSMLVFLLGEMSIYEAVSAYKRKHRDKIKNKDEEIKNRDKRERPRHLIINFIITQVKLLVISFIPVLNIVSLFTYLLKSVEINETAKKEIDKMLDEI